MAQNTQSKETTLWNLLQNKCIEIPIIQRDYAQGRIGKEYLRKTFLESLKSELDLALNNVDNKKKLKLDFVYGTSENGKIYPLDGQQRLTTLWLLHWYIALRSGDDLQKNCKILSNFTYETRITSREFCKQLCNVENWKNYTWSGNISEYIKDQSWFSSAWLQDPTISSMLNMLASTKPTDDKKEDISDGIEEIFKDIKPELFKKYWTKLTGKECPIVFYYLPITDMGLTDDLYIKMNARGKQLSSLENLKADLLGYVQKEASVDEKWGYFLDVNDKNDYLPLLLDTTWTGLFWQKKYEDKSNAENKKPCKIDEIFFAFINRFFWNEIVLDHIERQSNKLEDNKNYKYFNNSADTKNFDNTIVYHGLSVYKYQDINGEYKIPFELCKKLIKILGNYIEFTDKFKQNELDKILFSPFEKNEGKDQQFYFIPNYLANINTDKKESKTKDNVIYDNDRNEVLQITHLTQVQRVVFSAVCKFFLECEKMDDNSPKKLQQWMRVVWNLVSGLDEKGRPQIRTVDTMLKAIKFINNKNLDSYDIYNSLSELKEINGKPCTENAELNTTLLNDSFYARCLEECIKAEKISTASDWESNMIKDELKYRGSIRFLFLKDEKTIDWGSYHKKSAEQICQKASLDFYQELIGHCTSPELLKTIVYSLGENAWRTNLLNKTLIAPIHNMLMDKEPNENDPIKGLREALIINATKKINATEIYRLREKENGYYYFEVPYNRNQTDPIFQNPVAQSSSNP